MTKYKTRNYSDTEIEPIEIERETTSSLWFGGSRHSRHSSYYRYHDSWEDARDFLVSRQESAIESAKSRIENAGEILKKLNGMERPK